MWPSEFFLRFQQKFYLKFLRGFIDTWLSDEELAHTSASTLNTVATQTGISPLTAYPVLAHAVPDGEPVRGHGAIKKRT